MPVHLQLHHSNSTLQTDPPSLYTCGSLTCILHFGRRPFMSHLLLAPVKEPITRADSLASPAGGRLRWPSCATQAYLLCSLLHNRFVVLLSPVSGTSPYLSLLREYPWISQPANLCPVPPHLTIGFIYHLWPIHLVDHKHPSLTFQWNDSSASFQSARDASARCCLLSHPHPTAPFALRSDASDISTGMVLEQLVRGRWHLLSFFSCKLSPAERKDSVFDRDLLAAYAAI